MIRAKDVFEYDGSILSVSTILEETRLRPLVAKQKRKFKNKKMLSCKGVIICGNVKIEFNCCG